MEGDNNNNNKDDNSQNKIPEDFDPEENKDQVNEINDPNFNEEDIYVNPDEIQEIEEIDKEALQAELGAEMDIEENNNNDNNNNDNIENKNENNNNEIKDEEEEIFHKEYENFSTKGEIYAINFHQESGTLIIGDGEDTTYFYDLSKKEIKREEKLNKDSVNFIKFSFDNKYMLTASVDGSINIFLVSKNFSLVNTIKDQDAEINWIDWHPKAPCFAFGTADGSVWVYMANNINNTFNFFLHNDSCTCGQFFMEGKKLISGGEDAAVKIYDLKEKALGINIQNKKFVQNPITCLDVCKTKDIAVVCSIANEFCLINYINGNVLYYRQYASKSNENICSIENVSFCNNDQYIVYADSENHLNIFEMKNMSLRSSITLHGDNITKIVPSKKNIYEIYCSGSSGTFYIIDTRGVGTVELQEKCHKDAIMDFVVTENENFVITSSIDKSINLVKIVELKDD